ncbi:thiamine phosphate synthase [Belnapia sp. T18]|uniref:Thiamine phosphate synthase n=1 Tax=Belnapia arida TaxID=2804533 RepID=A0ABS1U028_9PROT|nr:thiamine phosphate synthase [Belnapia arida]MBL6078034.1 thiamine phosphate synthase [Belnapia arida]
MEKLGAAARRLKPWAGPRLVLVSDPVRLPDPRALAARLPPGAAVLARGLAPGVTEGLAAIARRRRLRLLVGGDGRLALRLGAGLHLPDREGVAGLLPFLRARRGRHLLLTAAVHGRPGLARARRLAVDAVVVSPVFPTRSHPGARGLGPLRWAGLARQAGRPAIALGGVGPQNAGRVPRWAVGLAAIDGFRTL